MTPDKPLRAELHVLNGKLRGVRHSFDDVVEIGRGLDAGLQLFDPSVSRRHCAIYRRDDELVLSDLGSRAGTRLNGEMIVGTLSLGHGDQIDVGDVRLRFYCFALANAGRVNVSTGQHWPPPQLDKPEKTPPLPSLRKKKRTDTRELPLKALELTRSLSHHEGVEELLAELERGLLELLPVRRLVVFRFDVTGRHLEPALMRKAPEDPPEHRIRVTRQLLEHCVEEGSALTIDDVDVCRCALPMRSADDTEGVLYVELPLGQPQALLRQQREVLTIVAGEVGRALARCQLMGKIQQQNMRLQEIGEQLGKSERRYRDLVDNTVLGIYRSTPSGRMLMANKALLTMLGYASLEEMREHNLERDFSPERGYHREAFKRQMEEHGEVKGWESTWVRPDGETAYLREHAVAMRDADGQIKYYDGTVEDISERRRAEAELQQAHALLEALVAALPLAVVGLKPGHKVELWNRSAERMFGWSKDEVLGGDYPLAPPELETEAHELLDRTIGGDEISGFMTRRLAKDGRVLEVEIWTTQVGDLSIGLFNDASRRRRTQADFQQLFETLHDGLLIFDPQTEVVIEANERACQLYGRTREELIGMSLRDCSADVEAGRQRIEQVLREGRAEFETIQLDKDGRELHLEVSSSAVAYGGQQVILSLNRDISARKRLEQQIHQSQKMEAMGRLAGGVAHDFNNLLTGIIGFAQLARMDEAVRVNAQLDRYLEQITRTANTAGEMTRQLLTFSRKQVSRRSELDLGEVVGSFEELLRRLLDDDILLELSLPADLPTLRADRHQLEQTLVNLVLNARDAMKGGGTLRIEIEPASAEACEELPAGKYLALRVIDTGPGVAHSVRDQIFEPFVTTKSADQGSGLGLSTVYGIAKQHGGLVRHLDAPGGGAIFEVVLPCSDTRRATAQIRRSRPDLSGGDETILVVDDDECVRTMLSEVLREAGYTVTAAADGPSVEAAISEGRLLPDLVLTDVVMPGMSGPQLAERLQLSLPQVPVVFMSAYADERHGRERIDGRPFLQKPFSPAELTAMVRRIFDAKTA